MKLGIALLVLAMLAFAVRVQAADFDRPLESGVVAVAIRASADTGVGLTRSVGLRREDTGQLVFCAALGTGEEVLGESDAILNGGAEVLLSAYAFDGEACSGLESLPSADRYRVVFGAPGRPVLLGVPREEAARKIPLDKQSA